ncbi:hypothetical protein niasHT_015555 [Heterodera trifolii]|uniref:Alpha N-terminal protein methyltransferase 1 n=1 Tax=Heterodera trifolii TaxID=157864 RepID=A0ABD2L0F7_9BILA
MDSPLLATNDHSNGETSATLEEIYRKALEYWNSVGSDLNGMLGGFQQLHRPDINDSINFLCELRKKAFLRHFDRALDCGCGIGRVTKHLLLPAFRSVDMVDFSDHLITQSHIFVPSSSNPTENNSVGQRFVESLHTFAPAEKGGDYDMIWIQWVTGQLEDNHLVDFLRRCKESVLRRDGCIVVKDNVAKGTEKEFDEVDNSWARPREMLHKLFERADCRIVLERKQPNIPKALYEVRTFALKPMSNDHTNATNDD